MEELKTQTFPRFSSIFLRYSCYQNFFLSVVK
ncbi:hypothetical protein CPC197_0009A, partial [Chlamydia psittaci C1/97]